MAEKQAVGGALHDNDAPQETSVTQRADACRGGNTWHSWNGQSLIKVHLNIQRPPSKQKGGTIVPRMRTRSCTLHATDRLFAALGDDDTPGLERMNNGCLVAAI